MTATKKWKASQKAARTDAALVAVARHILWHNQTHRTEDRTAYGAYADRVRELGLYVPAGYLEILMGSSCGAAS